jgi:tetratricopeptide (TPR) repeat protein
LALTRVSRDVGFTDQAIAYGEEELARDREEISEESESSLLELRAVLSSCYLVKGNIPRALSIATEISVPDSDSWEKVVSLWAKASAMGVNGDFTGALNASNLAIDICKRIDRPIAEARLTLTALECRIELEEISEETFFEFQQIIEFFRSKSLKFDVAEGLLIESRAHYLVSNYRKAELALDEALVSVGQEPSELKVRIQIAMSECCLASESLVKARKYLDVARSELENYLNVSPTMASSWRQIGQIYTQLGDVAQGYECLLRATEVLGLKTRATATLRERS